MVSQDQRGGKGSTNIQVANLHAGMTYEDVRSIAKDVFDTNFIRLSAEARGIANARADEIREEILHHLASQSASAAEAFSQPAKQAALFDAQKAYALSGESELKQLAIKMVLSLAKQPERSLPSIVLQETLKVLPNLTPQQLKVLRVIYVVRCIGFGNAHSLEDLFKIYQSFLEQDGLLEPLKYTDLLHLEYSGCGNNSVLRLSLGEVFRNNYPQLISGQGTATEQGLYAGSTSLGDWPSRLRDYWDGVPKIANFPLTTVGMSIGHTSASAYGELADLYGSL